MVMNSCIEALEERMRLNRLRKSSIRDIVKAKHVSVQNFWDVKLQNIFIKKLLVVLEDFRIGNFIHLQMLYFVYFISVGFNPHRRSVSGFDMLSCG